MAGLTRAARAARAAAAADDTDTETPAVDVAESATGGPDVAVSAPPPSDVVHPDAHDADGPDASVPPASPTEAPGVDAAGADDVPVPDAPADAADAPVTDDAAEPAPVGAPAPEPAPTAADAPETVVEPMAIVTVADDAVADVPARLFDHILAEAERESAAGRAQVAAVLHVADLRLREFLVPLGLAIDATAHPGLRRRLESLWNLIH